ncbi:MAG TPA: NYN domain-containing protein [Candidatus Baltobacteraceae bacterium]|nr:NYN domain-containing protein [Candidatus Baltobacteraceae bacterium]
MKDKNIGILTDADNTTNASLIIPIVKLAQCAGHLSGLVLFGNWDSPALAAWKRPEIISQLEKWGAVWSKVPSTRPGKNASDIALTYEAAVMAKERHVTEIWLVSGDSDFTPMINRLRADGISVVVFGPRTSTEGLRVACNSFILLEDLQIGVETAASTAHPSLPTTFAAKRVNATVREIVDTLVADNRGWFHGFVDTVGEKFGFIRVNSVDRLFFGAHHVDHPMTIHDLRSGDAVEFRLSRNRQGLVACHIRKTLAFRAA